jgi:hypothetical protein
VPKRSVNIQIPNFDIQKSAIDDFNLKTSLKTIKNGELPASIVVCVHRSTLALFNPCSLSLNAMDGKFFIQITL